MIDPWLLTASKSPAPSAILRYHKLKNHTESKHGNQHMQLPKRIDLATTERRKRKLFYYS